VRGMYYDEALAQCKLFPHKAARYAELVRQHAIKISSRNCSGLHVIRGASMPASQQELREQ
jgi:hypothetical protein